MYGLILSTTGHDERLRTRLDVGHHIRSFSHQEPRRDGPFPAAKVTLAPSTQSVPAARRFVMAALQDMDASGACDDAAALVSELATNAVIHARTPFTLTVNRVEDTVRVSVHDLSPVLPRRRAYGLDAATGRGLRLMSTMSSDWGIEAETGGKVVWFELPCEGSVDAVSWYDDVDLDTLLDAFDADLVTPPLTRTAE